MASAPSQAGSLILLALLAACGGSKSADFDAASTRMYLETRGLAATVDDLVRAVDSDAREDVAALLAAGADPDRVASRGQPPLAFAVIHQQREVTELLLAAGADADGTAGAHPLLYALDRETAELLLRAGASVDARDANGGTALMGAVMLGDAAIVDLLLESGADVDATDQAGRPALLFATIARHHDIADRLLAAGAAPLPGHEIARAGYPSFVGRYGLQDVTQYEIVVETGQLILVERESDGMLYAYDLAPLSATRFYRTNDPGAVIFEVRVEDGRVTGLARMRSKTWEVFPRLEKSPPRG